MVCDGPRENHSLASLLWRQSLGENDMTGCADSLNLNAMSWWLDEQSLGSDISSQRDIGEPRLVDLEIITCYGGHLIPYSRCCDEYGGQ